MAGMPNAGSPAQQHTQQRPIDHRRMSTPANSHATQQIKTEDDSDSDYARQTQSATLPPGSYGQMWQNSPFTTSLPPEAQQMVGPALDMNDPFHASLMQGSEQFISSPYYPWGGMTGAVDGMPVHPSAWKGMSTTLAPSALSTTPNPISSATTPTMTPASAHAPDMTAPSSGLDFGFGSQETKGLHIQNMPPPGLDDHNGLGSGQQTPGEGFWDNFVHDATWHDETVV